MKNQNPQGICEIPLMPLRSEPSETSELLTQLLFGEQFEILENRERWTRIKNIHDAYEGWADAKIIRPVGSEYLDRPEHAEITIQPHPLIHAYHYQGSHLLLPAGARLLKVKGKSFWFREMIFQTEVELVIADKGNRSSIVETALSFQGAPYLWGGKSILGMDCSGFVQLVYSIHGITLARDSRQQLNAGEKRNTFRDLQPGDLCFFDHGNDIISHVGIYIGQGQIIHSSGFLKVDQIDEKGIYDRTAKKYTHRFLQAKNILD